MKGILDRAVNNEYGFGLLGKEMNWASGSLRSAAGHSAKLVARYRELASKRDIDHPDALKGLAPQRYKETDADIELMARTMVVVRMMHNLVDELEKRTAIECLKKSKNAAIATTGTSR